VIKQTSKLKYKTETDALISPVTTIQLPEDSANYPPVFGERDCRFV
jgi:hypothetical protein